MQKVVPEISPPLRPLGKPTSNQSYRTTLSTLPAKLDFVILYKIGSDIAKAEAQLQGLLGLLAKAGLLVQVRPDADVESILVFVKCPRQRLNAEVYKSRSHDWLCGIRVAVPQVGESIEDTPVTDSERLRLVFLIITGPVQEGCAGITPQFGQWDNVQCIFPLHNRDFDSAWIKRWSTKWFIDDHELEHLCEHFGTKIALYFAFLQFYMISLLVPSTLGIVAFFLLPEYSVIYSIGVSLWGILFIELWTRRQGQLAARWNVRNCSKMEHQRAAYTAGAIPQRPNYESMSSKMSRLSRLSRELLVVPFALVAATFLALVLTGLLATEVFIGEVYDGPLKSILTFTPTVLFSILVGPFSAIYMRAAKRLTLFENHETDASHSAAITRKTFVLNFMTSYTALFLTLYIYLPFGHIIVPQLDIFGFTTTYSAYGVSAKPFTLDHHRLRNQLFYFAVTAQVVNLFMEFVLPIALRFAKGEAQELQAKFQGSDRHKPVDHPEEANFLKTVRAQAILPEYDTYGDYAELVVQFGYSVMFSPIWPLTPVCAFLNNMSVIQNSRSNDVLILDSVELRADAAKLCQNMKRPVPMRADTIGPWADSLVFLTWLGSWSLSSILYLLRGDAPSTKSFLRTIAICLFSEHAYFLMRRLIALVVSRIPNESDIKVEQEEYAVRKSYLGQLAKHDRLENPVAETAEGIFKDNMLETSTKATSLVRDAEKYMKREKTKKEL